MLGLWAVRGESRGQPGRSALRWSQINSGQAWITELARLGHRNKETLARRQWHFLWWHSPLLPLATLYPAIQLFISFRPEPNNQSAFTYNDCLNVIFADRNKSSLSSCTNIMTRPMSIMYGHIASIQSPRHCPSLFMGAFINADNCLVIAAFTSDK